MNAAPMRRRTGSSFLALGCKARCKAVAPPEDKAANNANPKRSADLGINKTQLSAPRTRAEKSVRLMDHTPSRNSNCHPRKPSSLCTVELTESPNRRRRNSFCTVHKSILNESLLLFLNSIRPPQSNQGQKLMDRSPDRSQTLEALIQGKSCSPLGPRPIRRPLTYRLEKAHSAKQQLSSRCPLG